MCLFKSEDVFRRMSSLNSVCRRLLSVQRGSMSCSRLMSSDQSAPYTEFKALNVTQPSPHVINVELNRPNKMNAMNNTMWGEIGREGASLLSTILIVGHCLICHPRLTIIA